MKLAIIGDFNAHFSSHLATDEAISHAACSALSHEWVATDSIEADIEKIVDTYDGYWIAPGSPYKSMNGALKIIQYARENGIPTLGTCGGFQHMVIEFARNVLGITDAQHAEYDPYASRLVINPLSCSLFGQALDIELTDPVSKTFNIFGSPQITENYYCNFGLNPDYQQSLNDNGFRIVGTDKLKEARILELVSHPFFIATLFVPQANSTKETPHKLVTAFLKTVSAR
ncbi:CTP synthase C-terminal region-related (seleno)protein [Chitinophaga sp. RAB17]|uniref:CTP synthase C-terminal region-related (seleno)protein n=1 Tax=Chitinophaga sp. RAB17 TaxID=3233049 RepID=UPI003F8F2D1F